MEISNLLNLLKDLDTSKRNSVSLSFVFHDDSRFIRYSGESKSLLRAGLLNMYKELLDSDSDIHAKKKYKYDEARLIRKEQIEYNPVGVTDSSKIEKITNLSTGNIDELLEHLESQHNPLTEVNINKIAYYYTKIVSADGSEVFFFTVLKKQKKLVPGIHGQISGNEFKKLKDNQVTLDCKIDAIVFGNEVLIFNRNSVNIIFSLLEYYKAQTEEALRVIEDNNRVQNFEQFKNDCFMDGRAMRRLTRLNTITGRLDDFNDNFDNIQEVIDRAHLSIGLVDGKLSYDGTSKQKNEILSCMSDSWYISILLGNIGEDVLVNQQPNRRN